MRLIDAEPMIKVLEKEKSSDDCTGFWYSTVCSMLKLIESRPVVEVKERKRGEWLPTNQYPFDACSLCGGTVDSYDEWDFCPYCGADMRGAE